MPDLQKWPAHWFDHGSVTQLSDKKIPGVTINI